MIRLVVLLSGRGSNFAAIHDAIGSRILDADIAAVISNRRDAPGIAKAKEWRYPTYVVDHKVFPNREAHEAHILRILDAARPNFIVLAGYMRLLSASFLTRWRHKVVNIHPSLLPSFPGVDAQAQALAHGVKVSGCTVHFVDEGVDAGPIIVQRAVQVRDDDDEESLSERILVEEHKAYVEALQLLAKGDYRVEGRRVLKR